MVQYGHLYFNTTVNGHAGISWTNVYLPYTYNGFVSCTATVRNDSEFAVGIEQTTQNLIKIAVTNHSDNPQYIYGVFWHTIGY